VQQPRRKAAAATTRHSRLTSIDQKHDGRVRHLTLPAADAADGRTCGRRGDIGDYDGAGYTRSGSAAGIVVSYATPDLKQRQNWAEESYYVRLDGETGNCVFSRNRLIVVDEEIRPRG
jgi:hypothetical protein